MLCLNTDSEFLFSIDRLRVFFISLILWMKIITMKTVCVLMARKGKHWPVLLVLLVFV